MRPLRLPNGRFPPGWSGNPGGRPRLTADVIALARQYTAAAIATLAGIMADPAAPAATRVAAASALLDAVGASRSCRWQWTIRARPSN